MSFPTKEERTRCWGARDKYWECLDKNSQTTDKNTCKQFRDLYEQSCSAQWVKHFDRKRNYLLFKEKIEKDGYEPLRETDKESQVKAKTKSLSMHPEEFITK